MKLEPEKINALLGTDVSEDEMRRILLSLGFELDGDTILVPSWRGDVEHYSDIAEEVARFFGYNEIPNTLMRGETTTGGYTDRQKAERKIGALARTLGFDEIITYSFISPSYYDKIRLPEDSALRDSLKILNPLGEDTSIMRTTVLPSMLEILTRNFNYRNASVKLYELGKVYFPREDGMADEPKVLCLGAYGEDMDFFAIKGVVEEILRGHARGERLLPRRERQSQLSPRPLRGGLCRRGVPRRGGSAPSADGRELRRGRGALHRRALARRDARLPRRHAGLSAAAALPGRDARHLRDVRIFHPRGDAAGLHPQGRRRAARECSLFDVYTGAPIPEGQKSVSFSLKMRADDQTLTDDHAEEIVNAVLEALKNAYHAVMR